MRDGRNEDLWGIFKHKQKEFKQNLSTKGEGRRSSGRAAGRVKSNKESAGGLKEEAAHGETARKHKDSQGVLIEKQTSIVEANRCGFNLPTQVSTDLTNAVYTNAVHHIKASPIIFASAAKKACFLYRIHMGDKQMNVTSNVTMKCTDVNFSQTFQWKLFSKGGLLHLKTHSIR